MRTYTTLLTLSVAMLFVSQVLASPAREVSIIIMFLCRL